MNKCDWCKTNNRCSGVERSECIVRDYKNFSEDKIDDSVKHYPKVVNNDYVIYPCNNQFNNKISYWISKRDITIAFYCFSVASPYEATEMLKEKSVIDSYIKMFDDRCGGD